MQGNTGEAAEELLGDAEKVRFEDGNTLVRYVKFYDQPLGKDYDCVIRPGFDAAEGGFTISPEQGNPFAEFVRNMQARVEVIANRHVPQ